MQLFTVAALWLFLAPINGSDGIKDANGRLLNISIEVEQATKGGATSGGGCAAAELPVTPSGECRPDPSLPSWCLPPFKHLNGVDLLLEGGAYIQSINLSEKHRYIAMVFKNMTNYRSPSFERTHWLQNKENPLGLRVSEGSFKIWLSRENFPPADLPDLFNFTTCAVVGSGLKLLKQRRGREIDAHGTIFRSNQAPTKGFEQFVGSRTDIRVTNAANAFFSEDGNRTSCIVPLIPRKNGDDVVRLVHKEIPGPESACRMLPMSPQFEAYRWTTFSNRTGRFMKAKWSSGFSAIAIAVQLCQQVDIYGYSFQGNYYFNKVHSAVQAGPNGERVPIEYRPEFDNRRRLSRQALPPGPDGEAVQRRRLQAMAVNGHSWFNEKKCTKILSAVLPRVQRHKM